MVDGRRWVFSGACGLAGHPVRSLLADQVCGLLTDRVCGLLADQVCGLLTDRVCGLLTDRVCGLPADQVCGLPGRAQAAHRWSLGQWNRDMIFAMIYPIVLKSIAS